MSERVAGIAKTLSPGSRIYYESLFSPFQVGRSVDLLATLASRFGVSLSRFHGLAEASLIQAFRLSGALDPPMRNSDPVMIEFGRDAGNIAFSVSFLILSANLPELDSLPEALENPKIDQPLARSLRTMAAPSSEVMFSADRVTGQCEILFHLPIEVSQTPPEGIVRYAFYAGESFAASAPNQDYQHLADVEYESLLDEKQGHANKSRLASRRIIDAATDSNARGEAELSSRIEKSINDPSDASEQLLESLAAALTPKQIAEVLSRDFTEEKIAALIAKVDPKKVAAALKDKMPAAELGRILEESLSPREMAQALSEGDPEAAARALQKTMPKGKIRDVLENAMDDRGKAELLAKADPKSCAKILGRSLDQAEIDRLVAQSLSDADKANLLAQDLNREELAKAVSEGLPAEEKARLLAAAMSENEFTEAIQSSLTDIEKAKLLAQADPDKALSTLKDQYSEVQLAEILKTALSDEEVAKGVITSLSEKDIARAVSGGLPDEELAKIIRNSMPEDEFAKLVRSKFDDRELITRFCAIAGNEEVERILASSIDEDDLSVILKTALATDSEESVKVIVGALTPERVGKLAASKLGDQQLAEVLSSGLSKEDLAETLVSVLPKENYQAALTENLPPQEIARALSEGLPKDQYAKLVMDSMPSEKVGEALFVTKVAEQLALNKPPFQEKLAIDQVDALLDPGLSSLKATPILRSILPSSVTECALSGDIPAEDVARFLIPHLPDPQLAPLIASSLAQAAARAKEIERNAALNGLSANSKKENSAASIQDEKVILSLESTIESLEASLERMTAERDKWLEQCQLEKSKPPADALVRGPSLGVASNGVADSAIDQAQSPGLEASSREDSDEDFDLEEKASGLDQGLDLVVKRIEQIKDDLLDERGKKVIGGMMGEVLSEKAKIINMSREMTAALKRKELAFQNREATLKEELRQARTLAQQRQSTVDRMKQLMFGMQQRLEQDRADHGEVSVKETQLRLKFEQSQRQIESLNREIEKLSRRAQLAPAMQNAANPQRMTAEIQKQLESSKKALTSKKQDIELLKRQINEKDAKESEYKKTIIRLQTELAAAKKTVKKSA